MRSVKSHCVTIDPTPERFVPINERRPTPWSWACASWATSSRVDDTDRADDAHASIVEGPRLAHIASRPLADKYLRVASATVSRSMARTRQSSTIPGPFGFFSRKCPASMVRMPTVAERAPSMIFRTAFVAAVCAAVAPAWRLALGQNAPPSAAHSSDASGSVHERSRVAAMPSPALGHVLSLMTASTPERRRTVKVLFYGQSISEQNWWMTVADKLRQNFPHAHLVIENRAIGGFSTQLLVRTAEDDVYPFYPDLVILHAYGSHLDYEALVRNIRTRTTADVLLQNDHLSEHDSMDEPTDPATLTPNDWTPWMNSVFLPSLAEEYGLQLADQRGAWKRYLAEHRLAPTALLRDESHLNEQGCQLMADIVASYLQPPATPPAPDGRVGDVVVGQDVHWGDRSLSVEFEGNRVDVVCATPPEGELLVTIDGKKPSEHPELYALTAPRRSRGRTGRACSRSKPMFGYCRRHGR